MQVSTILRTLARYLELNCQYNLYRAVHCASTMGVELHGVA
jgi:hypothetical protein